MLVFTVLPRTMISFNPGLVGRLPLSIGLDYVGASCQVGKCARRS